MNVKIITEGSRDVGYGHITRCTSLYQAFVEKGIEPEFIVNGDDTAEVLLERKQRRVFDWLEEKRKLFTVIRGAEVVILDSYHANREVYERISNMAKVAAYIDDNNRIVYPRGIVINGSIFAEEIDYPIQQGVTYLLGTKYIPIRKAFWQVRKKKTETRMKSIMITFGGEDLKKLTAPILEIAVKRHPYLTKNVIIGWGFKNSHRIKAIKDDRTLLHYAPTAEQMRDIMLDSDIAISSAGQTLYELARLGIPTIAIPVADNQMRNVKGWLRAGFVKHVMWRKSADVLKIVDRCIAQLSKDDNQRKEMAKAGPSLVDGKGAVRIVNELVRRVN